jgi:hypothetical protein
MSTQARLLAFGPFSEEVRDHLDYPYRYYGDVKDGSIVTATPIHCNTSEWSREVADALGFELWDFNGHYVGEMSTEQLAGLRAWLIEKNCFEKDIFAELKALRAHGFKFLFLVEG